MNELEKIQAVTETPFKELMEAAFRLQGWKTNRQAAKALGVSDALLSWRLKNAGIMWDMMQKTAKAGEE